LTRAQARDVSVFLPRDLVVAAGTRSPAGRTVAAQRVPEDLAAMDIGPETSTAFTDGIVQARTVFWNGTMGVFEAEPFSLGTLAIARAIGGTRGALTIVAGADCAAAVARAQVGPRIDHITTAGVAALALIEGRKLPGLVALDTDK
jgi:phosphoglycerate kinase